MSASQQVGLLGKCSIYVPALMSIQVSWEQCKLGVSLQICSMDGTWVTCRRLSVACSFLSSTVLDLAGAF